MKQSQSNLHGTPAIRAAFQRASSEGRTALITYLTLGYPTPNQSLDLVLALEEGGADIIELGVPFSDPVADGPTIQRASYQALRAGVTPELCFELVTQLRQRGVTRPLLLMGYYNPIYSYGLQAYVRDCSAAAVDGLIVPDLPPEEAQPLQDVCRREGLALVFLVAPTTQPERVAKIAATTQGFLYVVSRLCITGTGQSPGKELASYLAMARKYAKTPIAVGFGISRPDQARELATSVDGIIVGSGVVERASEGADVLRSYVRSLRDALEG